MPDVSTHLNGFNISANQTEAVYQWLDCNNGLSPISSATNQNYTATINGNYAVIVSMNGCSDTSACVNLNSTGINEIVNNNGQLLIFPNPGNGALTVTLWGGEGQSTTEQSYSIINEPAEFIRNIDMAVDIERGLEVKYPGLQNTADKVRQIYGKLMEKVSEFME